MNLISVESPTRVDLAGGTLDLWPLYLFVGGAYTVNFAIDIFTRAELRARDDGKIVLNSADRQMTASFDSLDELLADPSDEWILVRKHIEFWRPESGFELTTDSESPIGAGLGGSSSLSISLIKAFTVFCKREMSSSEMIQLAGNLEAKVLRTPTGTQDYYPPIFGGMNIIFYGCDGNRSQVYQVPAKLFQERFFLVYTGKPHHSGLNNWGVMKGAIDQNGETLAALTELGQISRKVRDVCENECWDELGALLKEEFEARLRLSAEITSPEIEQLASIALAAGAEAVKICGAGGGGCVMIWSSAEDREKVRRSCQGAGFQILNAHPVPPLSEVGGRNRLDH